MDPTPPPPRTRPIGHAILAIAISFVVVLVLDADGLHSTARQLPYGTTERAVATALTAPLADVADALRLNRPLVWADDAVGKHSLGTSGDPFAVQPPPPATFGSTSGTPHRTHHATASGHVHHTVLLTHSHPLRVLVVGDSLAGDFGPLLMEYADRTGVMHRRGRSTSGSAPAWRGPMCSTGRPSFAATLPPTTPGWWCRGRPQRRSADGRPVRSLSPAGVAGVAAGVPPPGDGDDGDRARRRRQGDLRRAARHLQQLSQRAPTSPSTGWSSGRPPAGRTCAPTGATCELDPKGVYTPYLTVAGKLVAVRRGDGTHLSAYGDQLVPPSSCAR